jgi:hypothetical protein
LKNIVNDIGATGDHVSQSLATLESNALTIEKINEINPYFGIDKVHIETTYNTYPLPKIMITYLNIINIQVVMET